MGRPIVRDTPRVLAPPPVIFVGALGVGLILQYLRPLPLLAGSLAARILGGCLILGGLALSGAVVYHFRRAETPVTPLGVTRRLVLSGPYRFSRNPMVTGAGLMVLGVGTLACSWSFIVGGLVIPAWYLVYIKLVEEKELEARFGDDYVAYKKATPFIVPKIR